MRATIEVEDREEAKLIRRGLADKETRALVKVMGALDKLPNKNMKIPTMNFIRDYFRAVRGNEQNRMMREGKSERDPNIIYPGKDPDFTFPEE